MIKFSLFFLIIIFSITSTLAHPWKPSHFVIIDTDGGIDDFRAISMMLASPDVRVLGITVTSGVLSAQDAYSRIELLLKQYNHEGVPVGINDAPAIKPSGFEMAKSFSWGSGSVSPQSKMVPASDVVKYIYDRCSDSIHFVCLGSLNIIGKLGEFPSFKTKTAEIVWSCSNFKKVECYNNSIDKEAYKKASKLEIPINIIDGKSIRASVFSNNFESEISKIQGCYAREISRSLQLEHKIFYDEIIPLWFHFPGMFERTITDKITLFVLKEASTDNIIQKAFLQIVAGETVNQNQVINFSWRKEDYFSDIQPMMDETVKKYGKDEWIAGVLANEMHRHLGVFAIVGTKMGVRAKEYFCAGVDEMKVVTYAGTIPPFSCMNDGLQISTGATLGHGLISVSPDTTVRPVADFTHMGKTIRLTLKPEFAKKIASEVKELNVIYGLNSNIYWELVRKLAVKYWANFDRHEIFTIEEI